jgi:hypothetical protein
MPSKISLKEMIGLGATGILFGLVFVEPIPVLAAVFGIIVISMFTTRRKS